MTNEDREEMYQDMLEESKREEYLESKIRSDYDFFEQHFENEIADLYEAIEILRNLHESYGYQFDIKDYEWITSYFGG